MQIFNRNPQNYFCKNLKNPQIFYCRNPQNPQNLDISLYEMNKIKQNNYMLIEHKHFEMVGQAVYDCPKTVVSEEYSTEYKPGMEQYYPVNDDKNNALADQYRALAAQEQAVIFGGRLAEYKYYDMAPIIEQVMKIWE